VFLARPCVQATDCRQYEIYLFECILLCCKEASANKSKDRKDKTRSQGSKPRNKSAKLQLKGRIFMSNVTEVVSLSKPGMSYAPADESKLIVSRFPQRSDLVEGRPGGRKLHHKVHPGRSNEEVGFGS
jgi:hypothetical protein